MLLLFLLDIDNVVIITISGDSNTSNIILVLDIAGANIAADLLTLLELLQYDLACLVLGIVRVGVTARFTD